MKITKLQQLLHQFACKSDIRPALACVITDGVTAVSTDSFRLVETKVTSSDIVPGNKISIPAKTLKSAKAKTELNFEKGTLTGDEANYFVNDNHSDEFPKYESIISDAEKGRMVTVDVSGEMLAEIAAYMGKVGRNARVTLKISKDKDYSPLVFKASGNGHESTALLMPMRV